MPRDDAGGAREAPLRFYEFVLDDILEGEHVYQVVRDHAVPHRVHKYHESAYAGASSLNRVWGRLYIPEAELERFMALTGNRLAPEPVLHVDGAGAGRPGCLAWLFGGGDA